MTETLSPSSITLLYEPTECDKRTWLRDVKRIEPSEEGAFQKFNKQQGIRHEQLVVARLEAEGYELVDIDGYENKNAVADTVEAVNAGKAVYQAMLEAETEIDGQKVRVIGYPDFLLPDGDGWVIADAKLARGLFKDDGKERGDREAIFLQLRLYGWLFEHVFPGVGYSLRAYNGAGGIEEVEPDGGASSLAKLATVLEIRSIPAEDEPSELVGWSKCGPCGYKYHCWPIAEEHKALGLVIDIDKNLAPKLEAEGITSYPQVAERLDEAALARIKSQKGDNYTGARRILENIASLESGEPVRRVDENGDPVPINPAVTEGSAFVMFDLEGVPPDLGEAEKVYMWGMQVFEEDEGGDRKGEFTIALAGFGEGGDEAGWRDFLAKAAAILQEHPGIRFVHWAHYEKTMINKYIQRYGDDEAGTGAQVLDLLLDLYPITKVVVALPLPSYSLKVVEQSDAVFAVAGFKRTADEVAKGDDSIAAYMEAVETNDTSRRQQIIDDISAYNEEDLAATWAVLKWLRTL